ncbi:26573_t:CDS:2, partial [Dentiscutata erythropus]
EDVDKSLVNHQNKEQLNEVIDKLQIESLSDLKNDIKRLSLSIEHFHDLAINDHQKNILVESFNYYLEKNQINAKSLDIDDLKIYKFLNKCFFKELLNKNDHNAQLKEIRMQAFNLELFYFHQRDRMIGDETFRKAIKKKEDWHK